MVVENSACDEGRNVNDTPDGDPLGARTLQPTNVRCSFLNNATTFTCAEAASVNEARSALRGTSNLSSAIVHLAHSAKSVQELLEDGATVHCFISSAPRSANDTTLEPPALYTIVSSLIHNALSSDNVCSPMVSHALRDAFMVGMRAVQINNERAENGGTALENRNRRDPTSVDPVPNPTPVFTLTTWFPHAPGSDGATNPTTNGARNS